MGTRRIFLVFLVVYIRRLSPWGFCSRQVARWLFPCARNTTEWLGALDRIAPVVTCLGVVGLAVFCFDGLEYVALFQSIAVSGAVLTSSSLGFKRGGRLSRQEGLGSGRPGGGRMCSNGRVFSQGRSRLRFSMNLCSCPLCSSRYLFFCCSFGHSSSVAKTR